MASDPKVRSVIPQQARPGETVVLTGSGLERSDRVEIWDEARDALEKVVAKRATKWVSPERLQIVLPKSGLSGGLKRVAIERGGLHIPGVATPSEAVAASNAGCVLQKLFPADALGGPAYLKAIRAPLDDIDFVPVGGITVENMPGYLRAGAVAVGMGSSLIPSKAWSADAIAALSRAARAAFTGHAGS